MKVELSRSVLLRQAGDVHLRGQRQLNCRNQQKQKPATRSKAWLELLQLSLAGSRKIFFNSTEEVSVARSALSKAFTAKAARLSIMRYDGMTQERFLHVHQPMMNVCV